MRRVTAPARRTGDGVCNLIDYRGGLVITSSKNVDDAPQGLYFTFGSGQQKKDASVKSTLPPQF
jgi:hypothetical protein